VMADNITFTLEGWESLKEELQSLPDNVKRNGIQNAFKRDSKKIEDDAKRLVRTETGRLQSLITARQRRTKSKNFFKYTIGVPKGKDRKDRSGAFYAPFIEFGTSRIPEKSYLRHSLESNASGTVSSIVSNLKTEINKAASRHNARMRRRAE
jgi:HK97 gp10 family phage protein